MPNFEDKRGRYHSANITDFMPATVHAIRTSTAPRDAFRVVTQPKSPEPLPELPKPYTEPIPDNMEW